MLTLKDIEILLSLRDISNSIHTTIRTLFIFSIALAITFGFAFKELNTTRIELNNLEKIDSPSLTKYQNIYESIFSKDDKYLQHVFFWKNAAFWLDLEIFILEPCIKSAGIDNPVFQKTLKDITALSNHLSYHYGRLNRLHGRYKSGATFFELSRTQLQELMLITKDGTENNLEREQQFKKLRQVSIVILELYKKNALCFKEKRSKNPKILDDIKKVYDYEPYRDLSTHLLLQDIRTFGNLWPNKADISAFENFLSKTTYSSLNELKNAREKLINQVTKLENRQNFNIPIIGLSVPAFAIGIASLLVNTFFLLAYFRQRQLLIEFHQNISSDTNLENQKILSNLSSIYWAGIGNSKLIKLHIISTILSPTVVGIFISLDQLSLNNFWQTLTLIGFIIITVITAKKLFQEEYVDSNPR